MEEKMMKFALQLLNNDSVLNVFKNLESSLDENGFYRELIECKEKIWHLNHDNLKLKEIGALYREKLNNPDMAYLSDMLYIKLTDSDLYNELSACLNEKGHKELDLGLDDSCNEISELLKISDRYCGLRYIVLCLNARKKYEQILKIIPFFIQIKDIAEKFCKEHTDCDKDDMTDMIESDKYLSAILSENTENIELNRFAINFNKDNEMAYANIIEYYINNSKKDEALQFYNEEYRKVFNKADSENENEKIEKAYTFTDVIWGLCNYYYKNFDFYNALRTEELAINYELNNARTEGENL